jgi:autotransporter-associated beta strand protein
LTGTANSYVGGTTIDAGVLGAAALSSSNNQGSVGFSALVGATNSNVTFATPGVSGILSYTGASAATNQTLVVNSGSIGEFDVATAGTALTWQGELTGSTTPTGFIKGGPGTLIIDGPSGTAFTNNYSGNITVGAGTLVVNGTFGTAGAGATLTLASGATLTTTAGQTSGTIAGSLDHTAGTISIPAASTTLNFSDPLKLDGGSISYAINSTAITAASPTVTTASQGVINAAGGLSYGTSGSEQIGLNFSSTSGLPSTFTLNLLDYSGTLTGTQNLTFTSNLGRASFTPDISTPGELNVDVINGGSATLYWDSTVSSTWDTFASNASPGTANWYNGAKPGLDSFHSGDNVFLAGSGTTTTGGTTTTLGNPLQTSITAASTVTPGSVTDTANSGTSYTISGAGAIAGGAAGTPFLTVSGGGTLTLETANTYAGNTVISNGTLNVGGGTATGSLGTSAVSISNGAELLYNVAAGTTFTNTVTGAGNLVFATVNNANEVIQNSDLSGFTGTLTVQSGILRPANTTNPLNPTNTVGANVVLNGGEIYWDTGSNHAPATAYQITINGTGTGTAGADNDGAIRVGSATNTTLSGPITVGSNSSIGLDGGASLTLTNTNALSGSNVSLSLLGGGTLIVEGNVNLGTTGALAIGTSPVTFAPPVTTDISVSSPITGSAAITINSATTPAASTPSNAGTVTFSSNPGYTGAITINTGDLLISSATSLGTNASGTFITGTGALGVVTGTLQLATTGTTGSPDTIPGTFTLGGHGTAADTAAMITQAHIENISGVNIISGNIVPTTGGDYYDIQSDAGSLTMAGNFAPGGLGAGTTPTTVVYPTASPTGAFRVLQLQGTGNGTWSGTINNGSTAVVALNVGNSNLTPTGGGTWTLSGVNTYTGPTAVFAGTLTLTDTGTIATSNTNAVTVSAGTTANINGLLTGSPQVVDNGTIVVGPADANNDPSLGTVPLARTWTSLAIGTSATVTLPATTGATAYADRTVLVIPGSGSGSGLSFADTTGKLDLGSNDMIVKNAGATGLTSITSSITQGYSGGTWTGTGITSTAAANNSSKLTALGVILNSNASSGALYSSFDGQTVGANDVLVKYTYYGDANLDGVVNGDDYTLIDNGYNAHLSGWENGDFNYSGSVTAADYLLIDNAYQAQTGASGLAVSAGPAEMIASDTDQIASPSPAISAVPEPGTLSLLAIGAAGMLSRRRRRRM